MQTARRRFGLALAADGPGSGVEENGAVIGDGQVGMDDLAQGCPAVLTESHRVAWGWSLPAQEWRPEVIEVAEQCWHVHRAHLDPAQPGGSEKIGQGIGSAKSPEAISRIHLNCLGSRATAASQNRRISSISP